MTRQCCSTDGQERTNDMRNRSNYSNTETWKRKDRLLMGWGMFALGAFFGVVIVMIVLMLTSPAYADGETYDCWVLCQPGDYVNIRRSASKRSEITGYATSGMKFETDWVEKNGFIHLVGVTEYGDGWIHKGYVVFYEPEEADREMVITGKGRVAARKTIDGDRRKWLKPGDRVTVYRISDEWAVTSAGFIRTDFLGE